MRGFLNWKVCWRLKNENPLWQFTDEMIDKVLEAEYQMNQGNPLKDFMDDREIQNLVNIVADYLHMNGYGYEPENYCE